MHNFFALVFHSVCHWTVFNNFTSIHFRTPYHPYYQAPNLNNQHNFPPPSNTVPPTYDAYPMQAMTVSSHLNATYNTAHMPGMRYPSLSNPTSQSMPFQAHPSNPNTSFLSLPRPSVYQLPLSISQSILAPEDPLEEPILDFYDILTGQSTPYPTHNTQTIASNQGAADHDDEREENDYEPESDDDFEDLFDQEEREEMEERRRQPETVALRERIDQLKKENEDRFVIVTFSRLAFKGEKSVS